MSFIRYDCLPNGRFQVCHAGLSHDHRLAFILTNPDILLIGPLETKLEEKQFTKDEVNLKMSFTKWQSLCIAATLTGGVYLPVGVVTLHNSSLAH